MRFFRVVAVSELGAISEFRVTRCPAPLFRVARISELRARAPPRGPIRLILVPDSTTNVKQEILPNLGDKLKQDNFSKFQTTYANMSR